MDHITFFNNRRTLRRYADKEVSDDTLSLLMSAATDAPTTGNMQLYSVIVTRDNDMKRQLAPAHFNQPSVTQAPVVLTFCADYNRFVKWCRQRDAEPGYNNFQSFMTAVLDTVIFAQQFCTLAEMSGLGCCYLGTTTYNAPDISSLLGLPGMVVPVVTLTVGYPVEGAVDADPGRLPLEAVMHTEKYRDYSAADIDRLYHDKEMRPDSAAFVKENGKSTLAQVFTDVRYTRADGEHFSKVYADFIRKAGFDFPE